VQAALASVEGVEGVKIDFGAKSAVVTCSSDLDAKALISAFEGTKFSASVPAE
jgi:copper chaperone CopZ